VTHVVSPNQRRIECEAIAREAGALLRSRFGRPGVVTGKGVERAGDRVYDVVTEVDYLSEQLVLERIAQADPEAVVLAEEGGLVRAADPTQAIAGDVDAYAAEHELWLVDPLDGTVNFSHDVPHFCVSIACWRAGLPVAGAIFDPMIGELFSFHWDDPDAKEPRRAFHDGEPVAPLSEHGADAAMVYVGGSGNIKLVPVLRAFRSWRRLGSAALALAWVGVGRCGAYIQPGYLNSWDWGAGAPFVLAAGGVITHPDGSLWSSAPSSTNGLVAATPHVHHDVADAVAACVRADA
jgi:myo-inositol-1(or 4)-monophosphatase